MRYPFLFLAAAAAMLGACAEEVVVDREEIMGEWQGPITREQLADIAVKPGSPPDTLVIRFEKDRAIINGEPVKVTYTGVNHGLMVKPSGSQRVFTLYLRDHNRIRTTFAGVQRPVAVEVEMRRAGG